MQFPAICVTLCWLFKLYDALFYFQVEASQVEVTIFLDTSIQNFYFI